MAIHVVESNSGEPNQWSVKKYADIGANEVFTARLLELRTHIDMAHSWSQEKREAVREAFNSLLLEGLSAAFLHLRHAHELSACDDTPILTLRNEYDSFYSKLWTSYHHRFYVLALKMGYKVKFLFSERDCDFDSEGTKFITQHAFDSSLLVFLREHRKAWQNELSRIRNKVIEHPEIPFEKARVVYTPAVAQKYFDNCWELIEDFAAILMSKSLSSSLEMFEYAPPYFVDGRHKKFGHRFKAGVKFILKTD